MTESKKPIIVIGSGGHSKVLIEILRERKYSIIGVTSNNLSQGTDFMGLQILGKDDQISSYKQEEILLVNGIGSLPGIYRRKEISIFMKNKGYKFSSVIHPQSIVSPSAFLGEGVQIMAGSIVQAGTQIGLNSIINTGAVIDHDCIIGSDCHVGPG